MRSETLRLQHEQSVMKEKIRENGEKIKQNKVLPYLVGNVVEVSVSATADMRLRARARKATSPVQEAYGIARTYAGKFCHSDAPHGHRL